MNEPSTDIIVAGIDPSLTNTGIVLLKNGEVLTSYLIQPKNIKGAARLSGIADRVREILGTHKPIFLAIEGYDYKGFSTIPLAECNAVIQLECARLGIEFIHAAPSQVKKFATGSSQADKTRIQTRYGIVNEHLADARALAGIAWEYVHGGSSVRCELEVIKALKAKKLPKPKKKKITKLPEPTLDYERPETRRA